MLENINHNSIHMKKILTLLSIGALAVIALSTNHIAHAATSIIIDDGDAGYSDTGWTYWTTAGYDGDLHYIAAGGGSETATWTPTIPSTGSYTVSVHWTTHSNRATDAPYTVNYNGGSQTFDVNQELLADQSTVGGSNELSGWYKLGTFEFLAGTSGTVVLSNDANEYVIADAVKFEAVNYTVDDNATECPDASFTDIQSAIDAAPAGETITVCAGTYEEQLVIDTNDLHIQGAGVGSTILNQPAVLTTDAFGYKNLVTIDGATGVEISGISLTGDGSGLNTGVYVQAAGELSFHDNEITSIGSGDSNIGILIGRGSHSTTGSATISTNSISGYGKGGIVVDNIGSSATIDHNTITGSGPNTIAQNGIQISRGATGQISYNTVTDHFCTSVGGGCADDPTTSATADGASGILLYASGDPVEIDNNILTGNQFNIWTVGAQQVYIHDNTITGGSGNGIAIWDADQWSDPYFGFTEVSTTGLIENNTITNHDNGLIIRDYTAGGLLPAVEAHNNIIESNTVGAWSNTPFNAEYNDWGDCTGPYHASNPLGAGNPVSDNVDFSPWAGACNNSISGTKFEDMNGDGVRDLSDPGLYNWEITLTNTDTLDTQTTNTDINGDYSFENLEAGIYTVEETLQAGWGQSAPTSPAYYEIEVTFETASTDNNFGNYQYSEIHGTKFNDIDGNGVQEGEPGLEGWTIELRDGLDALIASDTTDVNGEYTLTDIAPGTYYISEVSQAGWTQTLPGSPYVYEVEVTSGSVMTDKDFGNQETGASAGTGEVYGMKFNDLNGNGVRDIDLEVPENSEPGIEGWKIRLKNMNTNVVVSTFTDADGNYSFTGLDPAPYRVSEKQEAGWVQTYPVSPNRYDVTVADNEIFTGLDFGNFKLAEVHGIKYEDMNGNGVYDAGDPLLPNWEIRLLGDSRDETVMTDINGEYAFYDIEPGIYSITETMKPGWGQSQPGAANGYGYAYEAESGEVATSVNFGNYQFTTIKGRKYHDKNLNGTRNTGEEWLPGWTIKAIHLGTGNTYQTTTNSQGRFTFTELAPGDYIIQEILQSGWVPTNPSTSFLNVSVVSNQVLSGLRFGNATIQDIAINTILNGFGGATMTSSIEEPQSLITSDPQPEPKVLEEPQPTPELQSSPSISPSSINFTENVSSGVTLLINDVTSTVSSRLDSALGGLRRSIR